MTTLNNNRVSLLDERRANAYARIKAEKRECNDKIDEDIRDIEKLDKVRDIKRISILTGCLLFWKKKLELTSQGNNIYKKDFSYISVEDWNMFKKMRRQHNRSIIKKINDDIKKNREETNKICNIFR